ncbi:aldehyde dehydrogenase family protein [bacterium]|nr:aldehyde dehydrogenase family protein [bacterium]
MTDHKLLIAGQRLPSRGGATLPLVSPATEHRVGSFAATRADLDDAVERGAMIFAGRRRPPHLSAGHFPDPADAVAPANPLPFGLAGFVFTNDLQRTHESVDALDVGMAGVSEVLLATAEGPFGGVRESGYGREGGALGIQDCLSPEFVKQTFAGASR